jgi:hypothetical protein
MFDFKNEKSQALATFAARPMAIFDRLAMALMAFIFQRRLMGGGVAVGLLNHWK